MRTSSIAILVLRFVLLVAAQVLIFNHIGFLGFINPMVYVLFLYWYPIQNNRAVFLVVGFLLGLAVDVFSDSLALHTAATLTVVYLRPFLIRFCFGANFDFQGQGLKNATPLQRLALLALMVAVHHLVYFGLEVFSFAHFPLLLKKFFSIGLGTLVLGFLINTLFSRESS